MQVTAVYSTIRTIWDRAVTLVPNSGGWWEAESPATTVCPDANEQHAVNYRTVGVLCIVRTVHSVCMVVSREDPRARS